MRKAERQIPDYKGRGKLQTTAGQKSKTTYICEAYGRSFHHQFLRNLTHQTDKLRTGCRHSHQEDEEVEAEGDSVIVEVAVVSEGDVVVVVIVVCFAI